jgi:hypothetical protein
MVEEIAAEMPEDLDAYEEFSETLHTVIWELAYNSLDGYCAYMNYLDDRDVLILS